MSTKRIEAMFAFAVCATLCVGACAAKHKKAVPPPSGTVGENLVSATARVKAIDLKTRHVTLERPDGSVIKFVAGDEVRNLPQVKVGDEVTVTYYESLAYAVKKPGTAVPGTTVAEGLGRAKLGEKPGGAAGRVTTLTATIAGIDKAAKTVTLQTADGETRTIKVRHPEKLDQVSVGDLVEITYTEALAISVNEAEKD
jgi:Cu/Ag efflux protein CusF